MFLTQVATSPPAAGKTSRAVPRRLRLWQRTQGSQTRDVPRCEELHPVSPHTHLVSRFLEVPGRLFRLESLSTRCRHLGPSPGDFSTLDRITGLELWASCTRKAIAHAELKSGHIFGICKQLLQETDPSSDETSHTVVNTNSVYLIVLY